MIKIAFLDFDETLYSHTKNCIPESAAYAVNKMRENGIKVFLCSGRAYCEMANFDLTSITIDGMIGNNGQSAYDADGNIIFSHPISGRLKQIILDKFNEKKVPIFLNTDDKLFLNYVDDIVVKTQIDINSPIPQVKEYEDENIYMCSAFYTNKKDWDELFALKDIANITYWHDGAVDIVPNTASKAKGIEEILNIYGIDKSETICFGDSENDIEMFKYCNISVAVGNASKEVKDAANYISDDIDQDGIYNACKYFNLI